MGLPSCEQAVAVVVQLDEWLTPPGAPWGWGFPQFCALLLLHLQTFMICLLVSN